MKKRYSTTIQYFGSGLKYLIDKIDLDEVIEYETYKIPEGIKAIFITSLASIVEGVLKTYLKETVENLNLEEIEFTAIEELHFFEQNIEIEKSDFIAKLCTEKIAKIEELTFEKLVKEFEFITSQKLSELLNEHKANLFEDIKAIFKFRNLFIHGNVMEIEIKAADEFKFIGKAQFLHDYLKANDLEKDDYEIGDHFIEILVTKKLLMHFKSIVYTDFLNVEIWNDTPTTKNTINWIYNENNF